jgi:hypothetical protein
MVNQEKLRTPKRPTLEKVRFTAKVIARFRDELESLMYYPHPFTNGGFVIIIKDEVEEFLDCVTGIFQCAPPRGLSIHCLRRSELFELALPGVYLLPSRVNEQEHLALYLKNKGSVLFGVDLREQISVPNNYEVMLDNHLEACASQLRPHVLLKWLASKEYLLLIDEIDNQFRYLMGTALLVHGVWDITMEGLPDLFAQYFANQPVIEIWKSFDTARNKLDPKDEIACRELAFETAWLFESFLRELREHTP